MKFKVGDKVKIKNKDMTYSNYETWINKYAMQYKKKFKREELPNKNNEYIIKVKAPHILDNIALHLIQDIKTKQVYIINEEGIELVKENKKFFKKLPNNYTGTIEVVNGYIVEKEILDKEEKEYLSAVIKPFKDKIVGITKKTYFENAEYIFFIVKKAIDSFSMPTFEKGVMYKGMELNKEYTLKELGLDE